MGRIMGRLGRYKLTGHSAMFVRAGGQNVKTIEQNAGGTTKSVAGARDGGPSLCHSC